MNPSRKIRGNRRRPKSRQLRAPDWLRYSLFTLLLFIFMLWVIDLYPPPPGSTETAVSGNTEESAFPTKNEFDFHNLLKENRVLVETNPRSHNYKVFMQAGQFASLENARRREELLIEMGLEAYIEELDEDLYRVLLGPFSTRGAVQDTRQTLLRAGVEAVTLNVY